MSETASCEEIWKAIPGFEGRYSVSNLGRIFSHQNEIILKPTKIRAGYLAVDINLNGSGERKMKKVHQAVLEAFVGPRKDGQVGNHLNGIVTDNRLVNLEWCSISENAIHSYRVLGRVPAVVPKGESHHGAKLTDQLVREFREMWKRGTGIRHITRISGLNRRTIQMMLRGVTWTHIT